MFNVGRFSWRELTLTRVMNGIGRRLRDIPHSTKWFFGLDGADDNRKQLKAFRDRHKGERCFILANGPSLKEVDLLLLKDEFTFGMNRIYLHFSEMSYQPTYYVAINELVLEQFYMDIQTLSMPKFINWNKRDLFKRGNGETLFLKMELGLRDDFNFEITRPVSTGGTVTFVALQIAFYMGFKQVFLIGLDHSFNEKGIPNKIEVRSSQDDKNHFRPDYFPKGTLWQLPDLQRSELSYMIAKDTYEKTGRSILDATIGGKCPVFKRVAFESLF